jgi:hypothetical protein
MFFIVLIVDLTKRFVRGSLLRRKLHFYISINLLKFFWTDFLPKRSLGIFDCIGHNHLFLQVVSPSVGTPWVDSRMLKYNPSGAKMIAAQKGPLLSGKIWQRKPLKTKGNGTRIIAAIEVIHERLNPGTLARGFRCAYPPTPSPCATRGLPRTGDSRLKQGDEMRRPTIATMDNGLPVQCLSERDFLFPDADEKYVPDASAYIQSYDLPAFHALLRAGSPEDAVAAFPYLSDREKTFALRGLFENWTKELAGGGTACRRTSWNGWRGKGETVTPGTIRPALLMRNAQGAWLAIRR